MAIIVSTHRSVNPLTSVTYCMAICNWSEIIKILKKIYHLTAVRPRRWKIDPNEIVGDHALNHKSVANYILDPFIWDSQTKEAGALCNWIRSFETLPETSNKNSTELHSKLQVKQIISTLNEVCLSMSTASQTASRSGRIEARTRNVIHERETRSRAQRANEKKNVYLIGHFPLGLFRTNVDKQW